MTSQSASPATKFQRYFSPQSLVVRFVTRKTVMGAAFLALIFGVFVASKATGYVGAYPTEASRMVVANSFSNNVGLNLLFGLPHHLETVAGYVDWNLLNAITIIGSIWAFTVATGLFRGEEDLGRWEMLLSGQTTERKATLNALLGLAVSIIVMYVVMAICFVIIGHIHNVSLSTGSTLLFALTAISGAAEFLAVGALASQLMSNRSRAASLSTAVFVIFFLIRAAAAVTSAHWLLDVSPLGWIEKIQPLSGSQPIWLLPIWLFVLLVSAGAVYLAGRRDLGASTFGDNDSAEARNYLLNTPLGVSLRLTSRSIMSWVLALTAAGMYFGVLTKPAAQAFQSSAGLENVLNRVTQAAQYSGATIYLGIVFFLLMLVVMIYAAGAVGAMRFDEAEGYLDNLLVRPVSRIQWLFNRTSLIVGAVIVMCVLASLGTYATTYGQISGLTISILIKSGLNMVAPAIFVLGVGILGLGFWPRWSSMLAYAIIGWSFLIEMLSSGLSLNKWLLDTSLLHHIALSPATGINWQTNEIIIGLGLILCLIGALRFNSRDLAYE